MSKPFRYRGGWRMQVTLSNGKRPTRNFDNYEEAKAWGAKVLAGEDSEHAPLFGGPRQTSLAKALDHYARHFSIAKRGLNAELNRINHYLEGAGMPLLKAMKTPGGGYEVHEAEPARRKPGKRTLSDYVLRRRELRAKTYEYIAQLARKTCSQVSKADIQGLYAQMKSDGLSESTIQKEIALLKTVYNAFEQYNWKDVENPCTGIKLGAHRRRFVHLSEEQIAALERALANVENPYFWPLVVVAKESTLRLGSIVGMRWEQLNLSDRTAMLDTKTGQRLYKFSRQVAEVLEGLPRDPSGHVFPMTKTAIDSAWDRVRIAAGLPKLQFRDLRHLGATDWVRRGLSTHQLKHVLGHSSIQTAQFYVDLVAADMEDALDSASANGGVIKLPPAPPADPKAHMRVKRADRLKGDLRKALADASPTHAVEALDTAQPSAPAKQEAIDQHASACRTPDAPEQRVGVVISLQEMRARKFAA